MFIKTNLALFVTLLALTLGFAAGYYDKHAYEQKVYADKSNDDAVGLSTTELIARSGFEFEEYYVVANDGYITQLVRIINPDAAVTRKPPVMLFHGANVDNSIYIAASSRQHHPEPFPRSPEDGTITSANRSLAFTLANNGYDVWLVGQRGSNRESQAYLDVVHGDYHDVYAPDFRPDDSMYEFIQSEAYWNYGIDNIINHEIKNQIDRVLQITNSKKVIIFSFSISAATTLSFLGPNPDYAKRVQAYVQMGPAITTDHFTLVDRVYFESLIDKLPTRGVGFTPTYFLKPVVRKLIMSLTRNPVTRWSIVYTFCKTFYGPSLKYTTNLELNMVSRLFQEVSFKTFQQYGQISASKKLAKFDYGNPQKNLQRYERTEPPPYDVGKLQVLNWIVIWGTYDALADPVSIQRLIETTETPRKPVQIIAPGFSHLDLIAGLENDKYVNLPLIEELNKLTK